MNNYCSNATVECFGKWVANGIKLGGGIGTFLGGAALCAPPITVVGCGGGAIMMGVGGSEAGEAVSWFKSGAEETRGFNFLRESARAVSANAGMDPRVGEVAYYGLALTSNAAAIFTPVTKILPYSGGYLSVTERRLDTLSGFKQNTLGFSVMGNVYNAATPEK